MKPRREPRTTSIETFRRFIVRLPDGTLDVSGVISRDCYLAWLEQKMVVETDLEAGKFYKLITNHLSGTERRKPFDEEEEEAILRLFRQRTSWPCFPPHLSNIGRTYRARGFHEKARNNSLETAFIGDSNGVLSTADQEAIKEIIRFTIIGKSGWCRRPELALPAIAVADALCNMYAMYNSIVLVCDFTQKLAKERLLAQSVRSTLVLGFGAESIERSILLRDNLSSMLLAIGSAYEHPGQHFKIDNQLVLCSDGVQRQETVMYVVDPASLFLIIRTDW